jgi:hypothetical protein
LASWKSSDWKIAPRMEKIIFYLCLQSIFTKSTH